MYFTGWYIADPISSFMVGIVILFSTWGLLKESVKLILDGVPQNINQAHIQQLIEQHPMVESVHHLHIWALSSAQNALTAPFGTQRMHYAKRIYDHQSRTEAHPFSRRYYPQHL